MAQASSMGPPLSPRETRRSGRRSAHSGSTSTSKSPDYDPLPRPKDGPQRPSLTSHSSGSRSKRLKQEDMDDGVDYRKPAPSGSTTSSSSAQGAPTARGRRKKKDKDDDDVLDDVPDEEVGPEPEAADDDEEEEASVTRCVCGSTGEDDPDAGEFMVQCETCKVWQHGLCMGYESEDQLQVDDYYCEQCRPEMHVDLLRKLSRRQSSTASHRTTARMSRSHSPSHARQQAAAKRRNTMNSRDAAFDENLKEILESTAAEADGGHESKAENEDDDVDPGPAARKKRKRADDDAPAKKRTRSASAASEHPPSSNLARSVTPMPAAVIKTPVMAAPPARPSGRGGKRGGARKAAVLHSDVPVTHESGEAVVSGRARGSGRGKGGAKRGSHTAAAPASSAAETRRNQANGSAAGQSHAEGSRAYRNSHAYVVSQQPLLTSWHLPDYLAHLENIFPTPTPAPLEVPASGENGMEFAQERGVKTKWPGKRMSVVDMNKRVRALVEWVGREQASASERVRRREALEEALSRQQPAVDENAMVLDGERAQSPLPRPNSTAPFDKMPSSSGKTMKLMEELMEELINFQERFGRRG